MSAPIQRITLPATPEFLVRHEPAAVYAWWSTGRLLVAKGDDEVSLSADDLAALRQFLAQFEGGAP